MMDYRIERDSMGEMQVPADRYWGAQTQRSKQNFVIGGELMPREITHAFGILKKAAARANHFIKPEKMDDARLAAIEKACDEVISGSLNDHFPLVVWQTGSGTQSNMNANEVIANRANEMLCEKLCHPNDHVNMSQSSNDTFPTAMHIAAVQAIEDNLFPAIDQLHATFLRLEKENEGIVKTGRTHLQDATPIAFSQEISGWRNMLEKAKEQLSLALPGLKELALGGTAVGDHVVVLALLVLGLEAVVGHGLAVSGELHGEVGGVQLTSDNLTLGVNGDDGGGDGNLALTLLVLGGISGGGGCGVDTQTHLQGGGSLLTADEGDGSGEHENAENNADKLFHEYSP